LAIVAIIPARYAATRLPGKPLSLIHGKTLIERVYERARAARRVDRVLVATDDDRIADVVRAFGGYRGLPTSFLIDRRGRIRYRVTGFYAEPTLRAAVSRLLAVPAGEWPAP